MHFWVGVIIPNQDNIQKDVEEILSPYDENGINNVETHWDWWVIGGRWNGVLKGNRNARFHIYDTEDNVVKISEFLGLDDIDKRLGQTINKMLNKTFAIPCAIVSAEEGWVERDDLKNTFKDNEWDKHALKILQRYKDRYIVCVDCHY